MLGSEDENFGSEGGTASPFGNYAIDGRKSKVVGFGGASSDDEIVALGADDVGEIGFSGFVGFADALGGEVGGGRVEKLVAEVGLHGALGEV